MLPFEVTRRREPGMDVVAVSGELDVRTTPKVRAAFDACVADGEAGVVADYTRVTFLDSSAIGQLIVIRRELAQELRRLVVVSELPKARRILAMSGADRSVPVVTSLAEARSLLAAAA